ncbi:hypothetical protein [Microbacterium sp. NIBRBAC000506063]|uniref:hypothetical protein n=1 Tax=Microbacterium sp. NIBRBAC000506063 TaxID=2734618 RepID=UPI001BB77A1D|nr:hypothetical protein [Microbacterium sp. NIBRBAC000506063]QTV79047.1 hypothetical protein KAE78_07845 [Microbacterium sp. NIBRBAC000506063]
MAWGDRWELRSENRPVASGRDVDLIDYVAMYWFREPVAESVAAWDALGEASFQWGRGPLLPGIQRPMLAFFTPVKGYAAPRALVSPEVLPYRPNRGLHISVTEFDEPHAETTHDAHRLEDREVIPALLELEGVAGAWTFSFSHPQQHTSLPFESRPAAKGSIRIRLLYLEQDPVAVAPEIDRIENGIVGDPAGTRILSAPVSTIIPWQDW